MGIYFIAALKNRLLNINVQTLISAIFNANNKGKIMPFSIFFLKTADFYPKDYSASVKTFRGMVEFSSFAAIIMQIAEIEQCEW